MSAPVIETIRPGVQFAPLAAASFRRVEAKIGRRIDVNSTYRDYNKQLSMYRAWNAYVAGRGPYPGHSRAIHPDFSKHCQGLALDSDDWATPEFNALMSEHGWIRTAAGDPTERHHFEYQSWRDQHIGELAGGGITPIPEIEEYEMITLFNNDDSNDATRRAYYDGLNFELQSPTVSSRERIAAPIKDVDQGTWDQLKANANRRRNALIADIAATLPGAAITPAQLAQIATQVAALLKPTIDAVKPPTAAAIATAVNTDAANRLAQ